MARLFARQWIRLAFASATILSAVLMLQPAPQVALQFAPRAPAPATPAPVPVALREVSLAWNVAVAHEQSSAPLASLSETLGGGVCVLDSDGDGFMDLFHVGGRGHTRHYGRLSWWQESRGNRLLRNDAGRAFQDVTESAGLAAPMWGMGCAATDLDTDGHVDLVVTGVGDNRVYRNRGDGTFEDVTEGSGIRADHWSTAASIADVDGDGRPDIYIANYALFKKGARTFERASGFQSTADIAFDHTLYDPEPNRLYLNEGGFRFRDVAAKMGVADALGRSLGARFSDLNGDGLPDLLIINDQETPSQFFLNRDGEAFERGGRTYAALELAGAHDALIEDLSGDGAPEVLFTRGRGRPPVLLEYSARDDRYVDRAWSRGLAVTELLSLSGWAGVPIDLNNDGALDLFVANGSTLPDADSPFVPQVQANTVYLGQRGERFHAQPAVTGPARPLSSRGAVAVDLDNDGRRELVVANNNDPLEIFAVSGGSGAWLGLDLHTHQSDAVRYGARVRLRVDGRDIVRTLDPPQTFMSQGDPRLHVGLGAARRVEQLEITWRDGSRTRFDDVPMGGYLVVDRQARRWRAGPSAPRTPPAKAEEAVDQLASVSRILLLGPLDEPGTEAIQRAFHLGSPSLRKLIIERLPEHPAPRQLALVQEALSDPDAGVRLAAVGRLRQAELERSVSWLIAMLEDPDPGVQCAAAEAFRFFFDEEEAVTHRKRRAIAPLLRLLSGGVPAVQACAARALGAAESRRAVLPLLSVATSDGDVEARAAAIRALGLIRDKRAQAQLSAMSLARDSDAAVVAASMVALARLGVPAEDFIATAFDPPPASDAALALRLEVLTSLLTDQDGVVLPRDALVARTEALARTALRPEVVRRAPDATVAALRAIDAARLTALSGLSAHLLSAPEDRVRIAAQLALASLASPTLRARAAQRLVRETPEVVDAIVAELIAKRRYPPERLLIQLFERAETTATALRALDSVPQATAAAVLTRLLEAPQPDDVLEQLLGLCAECDVPWQAPDDRYAKHPSARVRTAYVACLFQSAGGASNSPSSGQVSRLRARRILMDMLADTSLGPEAHESALLAAAARDRYVADTMLTKRLPAIAGDRLEAALRALPDADGGLSGASQTFLWAVLRDTARPPSLRLLAAELLAPVDRSRVLEHLDVALDQDHVEPHAEKPATQ